MLPDPRPALARRAYYGWVIMVACFLATVAVFGTSYSFSVFYDALGREFDTSRSSLALVFGLQTALLTVAGIGAGMLIDRHGQRRVAAVSSAVLVVGLAWTAGARTYLELLVAYGVVTGIGMSGLYIVGYATLPSWFDRHLGTATGVASAGLGVGLVIIPPAVDAAITRIGWRGAMVVLAGVVALLSVATVILLADDHAEVGADPTIELDGTDPSDLDGTGAGMPIPTVRDVVLSPPFALIFVGWVLIFTPMYAVFGHIVPLAADSGVGRSIGVSAIAAIGVATSISRVGVGTLSDRLGRPRTFVIAAALLGVSTAALTIAPTGVLFLGVAIAFGIGYGGSGGLIGAVAADLFGSRSISTIFGILSVSFAIAGLLAPPLAGLWFELAGSYDVAFIAFGLTGVAGAGFTVMGARWLD